MTDERDRPGDTHPAEPDPAAGQPGDRVATLEAELAAAREEVRQANERVLRERADAENVKKRAAREQSEAVRYGTERLVRDLLPIVDNLERAVQAAEGGGDGKPLVEGVSLVLKGLLDVLSRHGVTRVDAQGGRFDPRTPRGGRARREPRARRQRRHRGAPARVPPARPPAPAGARDRVQGPIQPCQSRRR